MKPLIGITMGDPQGIGPEVVEKALSTPVVRRICRPVVFGDPEFFDFRATRKLTPRQCGRLSAFYIEQAAQAALQKKISAIVTAPISKERLQLAGYRFPGHTEYLAHLTGAKKVRLMMAGPRLKVILVTLHEPLREVAGHLSFKSIRETIEMGHRFLQHFFRLKKPRIAVAALNPHSGEAGIFGREEKTTIGPAVLAARRKGIRASGPFSPDTVFYRAVHGEFDLVVAMYHDQGLIPLKLLHFEEAVNITVGLPIVRTSVDHGTAFDIAGKGVANAASMVAAIKMAVELVKK